jgi:hypothetical protein
LWNITWPARGQILGRVIIFIHVSLPAIHIHESQILNIEYRYLIIRKHFPCWCIRSYIKTSGNWKNEKLCGNTSFLYKFRTSNLHKLMLIQLNTNRGKCFIYILI